MQPTHASSTANGSVDIDERVVIRNVSWPQYAALCASRGDSDLPRLTYVEGLLELMSPSQRHEIIAIMIARLLEAYAEEGNLDLNGMGNMTLRRRRVRRGLEPDGCYTLGPVKATPDLAIEVVCTHGGVDKLDIYKPLGVGEIWIWERGEITVHTLKAGRYVEAAKSRLLPDLDLELLCRFIEAPSQTAAVRAFRAALRQKPRRSKR